MISAPTSAWVSTKVSPVAPSDVGAVGLPLVGDRAQPVGIGQIVAGDQGLALGRRAGDRHRAGRHVVRVGHGRGGRARDGFRRAAEIGVGGHDRDLRAHFGLGQHEGLAGRAEDVGAVGLPLVGDRAQPVGIGQIVAGDQGLALGRRAGDRHRAGRHVVRVGHGRGGRARADFRRAAEIGVGGHDRDRRAHFGLGQHEGLAGRAEDVRRRPATGR